MLFWVGALMFRDNLGRISERHILARGFYANLDRVAATINNIILLHAFAKLGTGKGKPYTVLNNASSGFARRTRVRSIIRAGRGSWLRRRLKHRDPPRAPAARARQHARAARNRRRGFFLTSDRRLLAGTPASNSTV